MPISNDGHFFVLMFKTRELLNYPVDDLKSRRDDAEGIMYVFINSLL